MEFSFLGWPADEPTLELDHRRFSYAGKFRMPGTAKAVVRDGDTVVGAIAFDEDRTDAERIRIRYVTVRQDRRGEGLGPRLVAYCRDIVRLDGYDRLLIGVNNAFAYEALAKVGFGYTGETTGLAEVVLACPADGEPNSVPAEQYRAGLTALREHADEDHVSAIEDRMDRGPPAPLEAANNGY